MNVHHMPESSGVTLTCKGERYILDTTFPRLSASPAAGSVPALTIRPDEAWRAPRPGPASPRWEIEDEIERLLAMLDEADGDENLEDGGDDEHTLGGGSRFANTDRELDEADDEPSLGWTVGIKQDGRKWQGVPPMTGAFAWGAVVDGEGEHDGREPSLGACETVPAPGPVLWSNGVDRRYCQERWAAGGRSDLEPDADDEDGHDEESTDTGYAGRAYAMSLKARRQAMPMAVPAPATP